MLIRCKINMRQEKNRHFVPICAFLPNLTMISVLPLHRDGYNDNMRVRQGRTVGTHMVDTVLPRHNCVIVVMNRIAALRQWRCSHRRGEGTDSALRRFGMPMGRSRRIRLQEAR